MLLASGAAAQKKQTVSPAPDPPLIEAVQQGDQATVEALLRSGADVEAGDRQGATALTWAAYQGDEALVRLLVDAGASPHPPGAIVPDPTSTTYYGGPLAAAVARNHVDVARLLVEEGRADVDRPEWSPTAQTFTGWAPLHYAAALGQAEALTYLLERGADLEAPDRFGLTPLGRAVRNGRDAAVSLLLEAGADLSVTGEAGEPMLVYAARRGHRGTTLLLLDAWLRDPGADLNTADSTGMTALHGAALNGWRTVATRLLDAGANLEAREASGTTPLVLSLIKNEVETTRLLLDRGANLEVRDWQGYTPLHHAAANGDPALVRLMLDRGSLLEARTRYGDTPLHMALWAEREEVALFLIGAGADVDARDHRLWTPLHYAVRDERLPVVAALLDAGATIAWAKNDGWTPLHLAAHNGHTTLTQVFRCAGADPKVRTKQGQTPDSLAQAQGHDRIRSLLVDPRCTWSMEATEERQEGHRLARAGHYADAVVRYERARQANELLLGPYHHASITLLLNLASVHASQRDQARTEALLLEAQRRIEGRAEAMPEVAASVYNELTSVRFRNRDYAEAEAYLQEALRLFERVDRGEARQRIERATLLTNLGRIRIRLEDHDGAFAALQEAERLLREAQASPETKLRFFAQMSEAYAFLERPDAADALFETALALAEEVVPAGTPLKTTLDLPVAVRVLERLALYAARHPDTRAADAQALARRVATLRLDLLLRNLNQPQADLQHLLRDRDVVNLLLSFARDPEALPDAHRYLARWKGLLLYAIRQQSRVMQPEDDERAYGDAIWQIEALREQLVAWQREAETTEASVWLAEQDALVARKSTLERDLLRAEKSGAKNDPLADPARLRAGLAADEALLDVYRYRDYTQDGGSGDAERYGAILVTAASPLGFVDLGTADDVDARLQAWRAAVLRGESAEATWATLAGPLWSAIDAALPSATRKLWVSPDGALARLPWSQLGSPAHLIAQIDAPRELAVLHQERSTTAVRRRILLVGDVNFGADPVPFAPLPGTEREVAVLDALARRTGVQPTVLAQNAPDKIALLDNLGDQPYVHLATHGFFWASAASIAEGRGDTRSGTLGGTAAAAAAEALRLPLLESGLAVANANAGADGLLTAEELVGLDLSGVEVMVLSACDTGRGAEVAGQGVLGLRAALAAAGVRTLLMSLWPVPDASTALLMERFYEGLWIDGLAPAEALRQAQDALRQDPRYAAPVHWAAWVLAGEGW